MLPGYQIGGDFFDYAENDDGLWLAVGDAIGKGNTAAAISSLAVGALRAARRNDATLEQAAEVVHRASFDLGGPYQFLTAVFAVWHPDSRRLAWVNCGHPPPLLIDPDGAITELAGNGSYPLGAVSAPTHVSAQPSAASSQAGASSFTPTGVSERRDSARNQFGTENIAHTLRACAQSTVAATVRALQDAVLEFSSRPLRDDATILLVGTGRDR